LGVGFERCEDKGEKSAPKFVPSSNYHKEVEALKPTKIQYPSNPKLSFNPKRGVNKNTPNPSEEDYICMFCGRAGHLDDFCFQHKRMEKRCMDYARNSCHNEFIDFPPRISYHALSCFPHGPNHRSYGFGSQESGFVPRRFGFDPCSHRGARPRVGMILLLEVTILTLSRVALTIHIFPVVVHVPLAQIVKCKRL
jgi:hypothetical protein